MKDVRKRSDRKRLFKRVNEEDGEYLESAGDLAEVNQAYARLAVERMKNKAINFERETTEQDLNDKSRGFIGQRLFQAELNHLGIGYMHDDLMFYFPEDRVSPGDFVIPEFGSIEIKTEQPRANYLVIKRSEWAYVVAKNLVPTYVLALRINRQETRVKLCGYLLGSEVAKLPHNDYICPITPCHCKRLDELRPYSELEEKLLKFRDENSKKLAT